jgi:hypothetical protein
LPASKAIAINRFEDDGFREGAQHSQFLYSALSSEKTGSLVLPTEKDSVLMMAVTPDLKRKSLKILSEVFDIRRTTLFPDFDGFSFSYNAGISPEDDHRW